MNIEQINQLFSKYELKNFNKFKNYYTFESRNNNFKISNALFEKMLNAASNVDEIIDIDTTNLTFGVEFEFVGSNLPNDILNFNTLMFDLFDENYLFEKRYCHNPGSCWVLGKDGSIKFDSPDNSLFGYELSTPKLEFNQHNLTLLNIVLGYIKDELHGEVNKTCGTHIHIGFNGDKIYKIYRSNVETLLNIYCNMESTVFDPIVPTSRRRNKYCKSTSTTLYAKYRKLSARYCKFNFDNECRVFHVECRQLEGTLDLTTIVYWLLFQSAIINDIITNIDDSAYLNKLSNNNTFDVLFKYKFNNELIAFFIKRVIDFKSRTIQQANN